MNSDNENDNVPDSRDASAHEPFDDSFADGNDDVEDDGEFGDDFDDFEEGGEGDDFGDFDDGFQQGEEDAETSFDKPPDQPSVPAPSTGPVSQHYSILAQLLPRSPCVVVMLLG